MIVRHFVTFYSPGTFVRLAVPKTGWKAAVPIEKDDVVLDFDLPEDDT